MKTADLTELKAIFSRVMDVTPETITADLQYKEIPEWDSITHMFLIDEIEQSYEISILPEDVLKMNSVENILNILSKYRVTAGE